MPAFYARAQRSMAAPAGLAALVSCGAIFTRVSVSAQAVCPEKRAITEAQQVSVQRVDASVVLKDSFEHWWLALVGATTKVTWEVNDCGESTGTGADIGRGLPACVAVTAHLSQAIVEGNDVQGMKNLAELAARLKK